MTTDVAANSCPDNMVLTLLQDMQRPLYMQPRDAIEYGVIDGIVRNETSIIDAVMSPEQWDKEAGLVAKPAPAQ